MTTFDRDLGRPITLEEAERALHEARGLGARLVSPSVAALHPQPPSGHWRQVARELGIPETELCLLAANENALGPSPKAVQAAQAALQEISLYPDSGAIELKAALSEHLAVDPARLVIGCGSAEVIELLVRTFVAPDETVVTAWPSFVVYRSVAQAHSRDVVLAPLTSDQRYDLRALAALIDHRTKLVFIANPNNPTGTYVGKRELGAFLDRIPRSAIVVLDEAYFEYTTAADFPDGIVDFSRRSRVVVLRTFSKVYGLAGLRVGYGVMDAELADYVERVRQPYNVSSVAQAAAVAALGDLAHVAKSRAMVIEGKAQLAEGFAAIGLEHIPSQTNFVVVKLPQDGEQMRLALKARGILVRSMGGYRMSHHVRITVGTADMNRRVLAALEEMLEGRR